MLNTCLTRVNVDRFATHLSIHNKHTPARRLLCCVRLDCNYDLGTCPDNFILIICLTIAYLGY